MKEQLAKFLKENNELNPRTLELHHSTTPPLYGHFHGPKKHDRTGLIIGRYKVVGCKGSSKSGPLWVLKCSCGIYNIKTSGWLSREISKNREPCCPDCQERENIKFLAKYK